MIQAAFHLTALTRRRAWSADRLCSYQGRLLRDIVKHAHESTVYHRRLFDEAGISPENIRDLSDLSKIPVTGKMDLRGGSFEDRLAFGTLPKHARVSQTSGSTGIPRSFAGDPQVDLARVVYESALRRSRRS